jgi:hypothetical protein
MNCLYPLSAQSKLERVRIAQQIMIYFFNGAAKHASFFQMFIIQKALDQVGKPYSHLSHVKNTIFHQHYLRSAARQLKELSSERSGLFLIKGHWGEPRERDLLLALDDIKIFLIWRDFRDVLVSQFFFEQNKFGRRFLDFDDYYWRYLGGRYHLLHHLRYKRCWESVSNSRSVFVASFSQLKMDFLTAAGNMLRFAGLEGVDLVRLEQDVTVEKLREETGDQAGAHFRKGAIGDYKSIITSAHTINDIDALLHADRKANSSLLSENLESFRKSSKKPTLVRNFCHRIARRPVVWVRNFL